MVFETNREVLEWYERQPRALTPEFIGSIPWKDVKDHHLDERFVPVLYYMRDVETLTDMYHRELLRTPTGKDPHIGKFMERWGIEEVTHGEVINRFLHEAGYESDERWQAQVRNAVTNAYRANSYLLTTMTNLIGKRFTATHMTFGAIHEMEAAQGYRRLLALADHPVLTHILQAIIREESAHCQFYWSVARLELNRNNIGRRMARFFTEHFWSPVGQGALSKKRTAYMVATLFGDNDALSILDKTVTRRVRQLPGFDDINKMTETFGRIAERTSMSFKTA